MSSQSVTRDSRISLRASSKQREVIREAAAAEDKSVTEFVLESATAKAERVLADRRWFVLDETEWSEFAELLDAPVSDSSKLEKLLSEPSIFDNEE